MTDNKRGRPALAARATDDTVIDAEAFAGAMTTVQTAGRALTAQKAEADALVRATAEQFGYALPADCTDPDLIQRDIASNMRRSVEACLEVGRGLAVLKAACTHGAFLGRLEALRIETRVAQRFMLAARRFAKAATSPLLIAAGTQSKLFELLVLDDDQIDELELTGQTGELKLDDVAGMTVKELRAAVREARADLSAKDELLKSKNELLDKERTRNRKFAKAPADEQFAEVLRQCTAVSMDALGCLRGTLRQVLAALAEAENRHGDQRLFMAGLIGPLQAELAALRAEFGLADLSAAADAAAEAAVAAWAGPLTDEAVAAARAASDAAAARQAVAGKAMPSPRGNGRGKA